MDISCFASGERAQEKLFKEWLTQCHRDLDKVTRFEKIAKTIIQVNQLLKSLTATRPHQYL